MFYLKSPSTLVCDNSCADVFSIGFEKRKIFKQWPFLELLLNENTLSLACNTKVESVDIKLEVYRHIKFILRKHHVIGDWEVVSRNFVRK